MFVIYTNNRVIAVATKHQISRGVVDRVRPRSAIHRVKTFIGLDLVIARTTIQRVIAIIARKRVSARTAIQLIRPTTPVEIVIASPAVHRVGMIVIYAIHRVIAVATVNHIKRGVVDEVRPRAAIHRI